MSTSSAGTSASATKKNNDVVVVHDTAEASSVEEAGALLGAAVLSLTTGSAGGGGGSGRSSVAPPGMHSSFSTAPVVYGDLFLRLRSLRALLLDHQRHESERGPLTAAPSLIEMLTKLLHASATAAASQHRDDAADGPSGGGGGGAAAPPMSCVAVRSAWVDCVVLCHVLGASSTGRVRPDAYAFCRTAATLAGTNPRSSKGAGGVRTAAVCAMGGLVASSPERAASWVASTVLPACLTGVRSGGSGEPDHRAACVRCAVDAVDACREDAVRRSDDPSLRRAAFVPGAVEERALQDVLRIVKRGAEDRSAPEIREAAARLASAAASVCVSPRCEPRDQPPPPHAWLEELFQLSYKHATDHDAATDAAATTAWAEAAARCADAAVEYHRGTRERSRRSNRGGAGEDNGGGGADVGADGDVGGGDGDGNTTSSTSGGGNLDLMTKLKNYSEHQRRVTNLCGACTSLPAAVDFLVDSFIRDAPKSSLKLSSFTGSSSSSSSSAVNRSGARNALASVLTFLLRLQTARGNVGGGDGGGASASRADLLRRVLRMVGPDLDRQLQPVEKKLFLLGDGGAGKSSSASKDGADADDRPTPPRRRVPSEAGTARALCRRVLRRGLGDRVPETAQIAVLRDLVDFVAVDASNGDHDQGEGDNDSAAATNNSHHKRAAAVVVTSNQLQVALAEIARHVAALTEAAPIDAVLAAAAPRLSHDDHGVRHEAALVHAAAVDAGASSVTDAALRSLLDQTRAERRAVAAEPDAPPSASAPSPKKGRFGKWGSGSSGGGGGGGAGRKGRPPTEEERRRRAHLRRVLTRQNAIHGRASAASLMLLESARTAVLADVVDDAVATAETLVATAYDEELVKNSPGSATACVRAGYFLISSALTIGPRAVSKHVALIFQLWERSKEMLLDDDPPPYIQNHLSHFYQLVCLEALISSIVCFLRSCPEFLLSVPYALNRTTDVLERTLVALSRGGRYRAAPDAAGARYSWDVVRAATMEAFCWLPPGSYPLSADRLFALSAAHAREATNACDVSSLLPALSETEDEVLDVVSVHRAVAPSQTSDAEDVADHSRVAAREPVEPVERESAAHAAAWRRLRRDDRPPDVPPTPLHGVGSWRAPATPAAATSIGARGVDAAAQAFAASFALQDGREKETAGRLLQEMLSSCASSSSERSSSSRVAALLSESHDARRAPRSPREIATATNVAALAAACVRSLPYYEAYSDGVAESVGAPWMTRATDVLFALLPSSVPGVRRAAAEGLAALAAVGLVENRHSVQSSILHALDEVMQGNLPDGTARSGSSSSSSSSSSSAPTSAYAVSSSAAAGGGAEALISARAGSLLTLACLQRSVRRLFDDDEKRSRLRSVSVDESSISAPSTAIMATRVLACLSTRGTHAGDSVQVRAHALHVFGLLTTCSFGSRDDDDEITPEQRQILIKAVESVEHNHLSTWTPVTGADRTPRFEKYESEPLLLAVLVRLMTTLLPHLRHLSDTDPHVADRFVAYAETIDGVRPCHPRITLEILDFYETLSRVAPHVSVFGRGLLEVAAPTLLACVEPPDHRDPPALSSSSAEPRRSSPACRRAAVRCLAALVERADDDAVRALGRRFRTALFRSSEHAGATRRANDDDGGDDDDDDDALERGTRAALRVLLARDDDPLDWALVAIDLASGVASAAVNDDDDGPVDAPALARAAAARATAEVLSRVSPGRWRVRAAAIDAARWSLEAMSRRGALSRASAHVRDLVAAACAAAVATSGADDCELRSLQRAGTGLLVTLLEVFGDARDPDAPADERLLRQFTSQIASAVRHGVNVAPRDETTIGSFDHACEALRLVVEKRLVTDPAVSRRLVRPLLSPGTETREEAAMRPFPRRPEDLTLDGGGGGGDSALRPACPRALAFRARGLLALSRLRLAAATGTLPTAVAESIANELRSVDAYVGAHCGALALDGLRLSRRSTQEPPSPQNHDDPTSEPRKDEPPPPPVCRAGLTFANSDDVVPAVRSALADEWPVLAASSTCSLADALEDHPDAASDWLRRIVPLLLLAVRESIATNDDDDDDDDELPSSSRSRRDVSFCLLGLRRALRKPEWRRDDDDRAFFDDLGETLSTLHDKVVVETKEEEESTNNDNNEDESVLLSQTCGLVEDACRVRADTGSDLCRRALVKVTLTPLRDLQDNIVDYASASLRRKKVVLSCVRAVKSLVESGGEDDTVLRVATHFAASFDHHNVEDNQHDDNDDDDVDSAVRTAASELLRACCARLATTNERRALARDTASAGNWDAWNVIRESLLEEDDDESGHLDDVVDAFRRDLADHDDVARHAAALRGLRVAAQRRPRTTPIAIMERGLGALVLVSLRRRGLARVDDGASRSAVCADAMRVVLLFVGAAIDAAPTSTRPSYDLSRFLVVAFRICVALVDFNGLPRVRERSDQEPAADAALGRLCAQAMVFVAKRDPTAFKTSLVGLEADERSTLEFAVRAEMSGYATQQGGATTVRKKKLSLSGFKKQ